MTEKNLKLIKVSKKRVPYNRTKYVCLYVFIYIYLKIIVNHIKKYI